MCVHVLLNAIHMLNKRVKISGFVQHCFAFFATSLINSTIQIQI